MRPGWSRASQPHPCVLRALGGGDGECFGDILIGLKLWPGISPSVAKGKG